MVILGMYMLLWGKDKDQEYNASSSKELQGSDLDWEKQAKMADVSSVQNDSQPETKTMT